MLKYYNIFIYIPFGVFSCDLFKKNCSILWQAREKVEIFGRL